MVKTNAQDSISRQMAIDALMDEFKRVPTTAIRAKNRIEQLPPASPKKGKWIKITHTLYKCDQCGAVQIKSAYCKDCNAEMEMTE